MKIRLLLRNKLRAFLLNVLLNFPLMIFHATNNLRNFQRKLNLIIESKVNSLVSYKNIIKEFQAYTCQSKIILSIIAY